MKLEFQEPCLIVLAGPSGSGKSTWAGKQFVETAIVSSDRCRAMLSDDETDQTVSQEAFELLGQITSRRLKLGKTTVVDSTALLARDRAGLLEIASEQGVEAYLIIFNADETECLQGQKGRSRQVPEKVVHRHVARLEGLLRENQKGVTLKEGWKEVHVLPRQALDSITVSFQQFTAPGYDVIGDVHGCASELGLLLDHLGYEIKRGVWEHPEGRMALFLGDLTDRGNASMEVLRIVWKMTRRESGYLAVLGNHDWKIYRALVQERDVKINNGLDRSIREFDALTRGEQTEIKQILDDLFSKAPASTALAAPTALAGPTALAEKRLVLTHGALRPEDLGKRPAASRRDPLSARSLYGEVSGMDEEGRPIRDYAWVREWDDYPNTTLIFGHDVQGWDPVWLSGQVLGLDTGCCFGGRLSACRYPEGDILQVDSLMGEITHERLQE